MAHPAVALPRPFASGAGAIGKLIDEFDWSATSLGPISGWPGVVRHTVDLILRSPLPMVTMWGADGIMIYNEGYARIAAGRHPQQLGAPVRASWPDEAAFNDNVMRVCMGGASLSYRDAELTLGRHGAPEQVWLNLDYSPIVAEDGSVAGVLALVVETTDKVRAERYLAGEQDRLRAMFGQAPGFMAMLTGPQHRYELVNDAYLGLVERSDVIGRSVREVLPEVASQGFIALLDGVYASGEPYSGAASEVWLTAADGASRLHYLDFVFQPVRDPSGTVFGIFVQGNDVTERVQAERAVRASEARFRSFAQAMPSQVWAADARGQLNWFNERILAYTGLAHEDLLGDGWGRVVHPGDLQMVRSRWTEAVATGTVYEAEVRLRRADGSYRWHLNRALPLHGGAGAAGVTDGWVGTNTDIEEQKNTAQRYAALSADLQGQVALRTAERDRMWRLSKDILLVCGYDGRVEAVSPAFGTLLGWQETDILGKNFMELVHQEDRGATVAQMAALARGVYVYKFENRFRRKDGGWCLLSWNAAGDEGQVHAIGRDITADREQLETIRRTELALQQSQKMETIGKLTGGVAHDFNNLLQIISGNLQLLQVSDLARRGSGDAARWIDSARSAVDKGAKLASYLLAFGRRQPLEPKVVRIGRLVSSMEDMLRRSLGEEIAIEMVISGGLWNTAVDVTQVENALLNLAINARDAMAGSGDGQRRLTIEATNAVLDDLYCRSHGDVMPGQYVMLAVSDTGCGMPPEVVAHAFEPFFSTKQEGKGTGLGLSMVYGFVKQSGGHVKIYSEPGRGTTVKVYLPRSTAAEDPVGPVETGQAETGSETILVAEDDEAVRATVVEMLRGLGYRVLKAPDAASALAVIDSGVPIDLLFTDVVMPGTLRSTDLARMARERLPGLAVLFTSGYTENAIVHGGRLDHGVELLGKPYTRERLAGRIRQVLAGQKQGAAMPVPAPAPGAMAAANGPLSIVLVEDEDSIRASTAALLAHLGHRVQAAADAEAALALIGADTDVLVTDVQLPGMSGDALAAQAHARAPGMRIVFATGNGEVANWPDAVVLRKPYDLDALLRVLGRPAALA
ncbi:PAS domain S-box protein [Massilia oculi]|uniref:histidine kinase n=1 Tax=Massilia hydrophila TaxID=3044279 RepID=A0ABS7Y7L0_9BURK|nr:PAS domain S-box protein [Massilia oculi]MCA1855660.1 PAS domain S-box protein [Massilia oculi]